MQKVDTLIIGQGLAGSLVAYFLHKAGRSLVVIDPGLPHTSSRIAAGMFTPISGKRMALKPMAEILIPFAKEIYKEMERLLGESFLHEEPIYHAYGSVKEQNDLAGRMDDPEFAKYVNLDPMKEPGVQQPLGAFEVGESGWLDTGLFVTAYRKYLGSRQALLEEMMDYDQLTRTEDGWIYKNINAGQVVFCEGYRVKDNPFFHDLGVIPCRGDILQVSCANGPKGRMVKKNAYLVHTGGETYKTGSTYLWENEDDQPSMEMRQVLTDKLSALLAIPYEVIGHLTGIRPTTKNRKPIMQVHPEHADMFALNGLGTNGVLFGPWYARELCAMLLAGSSGNLPAIHLRK